MGVEPVNTGHYRPMVARRHQENQDRAALPGMNARAGNAPDESGFAQGRCSQPGDSVASGLTAGSAGIEYCRPAPCRGWRRPGRPGRSSSSTWCAFRGAALSGTDAPPGRRWRGQTGEANDSFLRMESPIRAGRPDIGRPYLRASSSLTVWVNSSRRAISYPVAEMRPSSRRVRAGATARRRCCCWRRAARGMAGGAGYCSLPRGWRSWNASGWPDVEHGLALFAGGAGVDLDGAAEVEQALCTRSAGARRC